MGTTFSDTRCVLRDRIAETVDELFSRLEHWEALYRAANESYGARDEVTRYYGSKCSECLEALARVDAAHKWAVYA